MKDENLESALMEAIGKLHESTGQLAGSIRDATAHEAKYRYAVEQEAMAEDAIRLGIIERGVPGSNETARTAYLRHALNADPVVAQHRRMAQEARTDRDTREAEARIWEARTRAALAEVAALTAIVRLRAADGE